MRAQLAPDDAGYLRYLDQAKLGSPRAMCELGKCYMEGLLGVEQSHEQAVMWFRAAANARDAEAMNCLGLCLQVASQTVALHCTSTVQA